MDIKAVILDYGMVLCHPPTSEEIGRMTAVLRVERAQFNQLWGRNRDRYDRGDLSPEKYWSLLAAEAGVALTPAQLDQLYGWDVEMWAHPDPLMIGWAKELHASGIKTGVLSNMHQDMIAYARRNFAWLRDFDHLTLSAEVSLVKPDAAIYEHSLRGLGVAAPEALFIDDREANVQGARSVGMRAMLFQSPAQLRKDLGRLGFTILPRDGSPPRSPVSAPPRNG